MIAVPGNRETEFGLPARSGLFGSDPAGVLTQSPERTPGRPQDYEQVIRVPLEASDPGLTPDAK
jgi:hypothetical protein